MAPPAAPGALPGLAAMPGALPGLPGALPGGLPGGMPGLPGEYSTAQSAAGARGARLAAALTATRADAGGRCRCAVAALSLHCRCTVATLSLRAAPPRRPAPSSPNPFHIRCLVSKPSSVISVSAFCFRLDIS